MGKYNIGARVLFVSKDLRIYIGEKLLNFVRFKHQSFHIYFAEAKEIPRLN